MKRSITTVAVLGALLGLGAPALAAGGPDDSKDKAAVKAQQGKTVALSVTVIEMTKSGTSIDPKLKHLSRYFAKSFKDYKSFKHKASHAMTLTQGKAGLQTVAGKRLEAEYLGLKDKLMRVQVKFDGARMTMKVRNNGLWFHAGRKGKDGKVTVLALRARLK